MNTYTSIVVFVAVFVGLGLSTPSPAQQLMQSQTDIPKDPFETKSSSAPYTGITIASITVAPETDNVPCFDCVPDAGGHIALPLPRHVARAQEKNWSTAVLFNSNLPEGSCRISTSWLHLGSQEVILGPLTTDFDDCSGRWGLQEIFNITIPNKVGDVMVIGTVQSELGIQASSWELIKIIE
jgi:hypothetical protein